MPQVQLQRVGNFLSPQFHDLWGLQSLISVGFVLPGALLGPRAAAQRRPRAPGLAVSPCHGMGAALPWVLGQLLLARDGPRSGSATGDEHSHVLPSILHPPMHIPCWHCTLESEFSGPHLEMGSSDLFLNYGA